MTYCLGSKNQNGVLVQKIFKSHIFVLVKGGGQLFSGGCPLKTGGGGGGVSKGYYTPMNQCTDRCQQSE